MKDLFEPLAPRARANRAGAMPDPEVRERPVRRRTSAEQEVLAVRGCLEPSGAPDPAPQG